MMHQLLRDPDDWDRYLRLLAEFDGRETEFEARASLLIQERLDRGLGHAEAVHEGLDAAERVERALRSREPMETRAPIYRNQASTSPRAPGSGAPRRAPLPSERRRVYVSAVAAMAAGLLIGVLMPWGQGPRSRGSDLTWRWRGKDASDSGSVALWGEALQGESLRERIGQGVSPIIRYRPGKIRIQWIRPSGSGPVAVVAYLLDATGVPRALEGGSSAFTRLDDVMEVSLPAGTVSLVVVAYPNDDDPGLVVSEAGDGKRATDGAGTWQMISFQLVEEGP